MCRQQVHVRHKRWRNGWGNNSRAQIWFICSICPLSLYLLLALSMLFLIYHKLALWIVSSHKGWKQIYIYTSVYIYVCSEFVKWERNILSLTVWNDSCIVVLYVWMFGVSAMAARCQIALKGLVLLLLPACESHITSFVASFQKFSII